MSEEKIYYVYIYLDPRKQGQWKFEDKIFDFEPFYVGEGKGQRFLDHLRVRSLNSKSLKNHKIKKIMKETGLNPTIVKIQENLTKQEALALEIKSIKHFGRLDLGTGILTNLTDGGLGVAKSTRKSGSKISKSKLSSPISRSRKIIQKTLDGEIVKTWNTLAEASRAMGFRKETSIRQCLTGRCKQSAGYKWDYGEFFIPPVLPLTTKEVFQYDLMGNFIKSYPSAKQAIKELNLNVCATGLRATARDEDEYKIYTTGGFKWFYSYKGETLTLPTDF